jgi:L-aspartate oxidase
VTLSVLTTDVLVVGSGVAGLSAALAAAPARVIVATKGAAVSGSTPLAQGGIAAALGSGDDAARHAADTLAVGAGLNDHEAVAVLTAEGPRRVLDLIEAGARFDRDGSGGLLLSREAGHSTRRIVHSDGDATGAEVAATLVSAAAAAGHITLLENVLVADLIVSAGRVVGATARAADGTRLVIAAAAVVLATGGIGRAYANTSNPVEVTGDGLAMAARAGARVADLEFVQFHPTALDVGADPMPLVTEALRGEGAVLLDGDGRRFMVGEHPDAELAPRDVVARAVYRHTAGGDSVALDATAAVGVSFPDRFPTVYAACREAGIDPRVEPIPVAPAAHYHMGGVATDLDGATSLPGLFAVGETSRTGAHGGNRLASNSLLEGLVFGRRSGRAAGAAPPVSPAAAEAAAVDPGAEPDPQPDVIHLLREIMWDRVGVVRTARGLRSAVEDLERLDEKTASEPSETRALVEVARLVAAAALARPESLGAHHVVPS